MKINTHTHMPSYLGILTYATIEVWATLDKVPISETNKHLELNRS